MIGDKGLLDGASAMTTRRMFLTAGAGAAVGMALPGCVGLGRHENAAVRMAMRKAVADGLYGGLVVGSNRGELYVEGRRTYFDPPLPMTETSLFDLASVGKTQTAALCALLVADGKLDPDAPFTDYLPEHVLAKENCRITVRDLATHSGGFDNAKPYMTPDVRKMWPALWAKRPVRARGERFQYACSNFVYLGLIVERAGGFPDLDTAAKRRLWGPLGMDRTTWNVVTGEPDVVEFAPSTYGGPRRKIGEHNDVCAHYAPRPMGNGSCFSTCGDVLRFLDDLVRRETFPQTYYDLLLSPSFVGDGHRRSFGFDMTAPRSTFSDWCQTGFSDRAVCHAGWTGPAVAVDPETGFAGCVLGNQCAGKEQTMGPRMNLLELMRRE